MGSGSYFNKQRILDNYKQTSKKHFSNKSKAFVKLFLSGQITSFFVKEKSFFFFFKPETVATATNA